MAASNNKQTSSSGRSRTSASRTSAAKKRTAKRRTSAASAAKSGRSRAGAVNRKKGSRSGRKNTGREQMDYALHLEIFLWIVLAAAVLIFFSLLGYCGVVGEAAAGLVSGLFGIMSYLFPVMLFFLTAFLISNAGSRIAKVKACGILLLFGDLCGIMQMALVGYSSTYTLHEYYEAGMVYHTGGGAVGGALCSLFGRVIGVVGTWIVLLVLLTIALILITQRSLLKDVRKGSHALVNKARADRQERRSEREAWLSARSADKNTANEPQNRQQGSETQENTEPNERDLRDTYDPDTLSAFTIARRARTKSGVNMNTTIAQVSSGRSVIDVPLKTNDEGGDEPEELIGGKEPAAMKAIRKGVKKKPLSQASLPDELFQNAFSGGTDAEADAEAAGIENAAETPAQKAPSRKKRPKESAQELQQSTDSVAAQIAEKEDQEAEQKTAYIFPEVSLLKTPPKGRRGTTQEELRETAQRLQQVFQTFGVDVRITNVTCGPSVTRYELTPAMGVKVSRIVNLQDDIKLNLAAQDIRIEAPIPGKAAVGIEVPNKQSSGVLLRELLESDEFRKHPSHLAYAVGKDIAGNIIVSDIAKMPHLLIAGATGSGKSVFINTLIMSILYKASPDEVKMILIDPKVVELSVYNGVPHLFIPVVTDPKKAAGALNWAVAEMQKRYQMFAEAGVRDLKGYNKRVDAVNAGDAEKKLEKLPQIVIVVDELADLMMVASGDVEDAICRLAQLARAAGIHLVIATQRPSVDVITGLIKANMPSRIAFSVSSGVDSRTILDQVGAEKLLGNGDMLFSPQTYKQPLRVQGAFVSDAEVADVTDFLKNQRNAESYNQEIAQRIETVEKASVSTADAQSDVDELFAQAGKFIIEKDKASIGMLQRWFKIGFNRAARIMDQLSDAGVVGPEEGTKPRKVLMSEEQFENYLEQN